MTKKQSIYSHLSLFDTIIIIQILGLINNATTKHEIWQKGEASGLASHCHSASLLPLFIRSKNATSEIILDHYALVRAWLSIKYDQFSIRSSLLKRRKTFIFKQNWNHLFSNRIEIKTRRASFPLVVLAICYP